MSLPPDYVIKMTAAAKGRTLYGERLDEMSREELLAAAVDGWTRFDRLVNPQPSPDDLKRGRS